jgi:hypothetical protein
MIKVYRYELSDGGGPFFTKEGKSRYPSLYPNMFWENKNILSGAISPKALNDIFKNYNVNLNEYKLKEYENVEILYYNNLTGEVRFKFAAGPSQVS